MAKTIKPVWKDHEVKNNVWELELGGLRITVHRHIHHPPDAWLLSVRELGISSRVLANKELELAKVEALDYLDSLLTNFQSKVRMALSDQVVLDFIKKTPKR